MNHKFISSFSDLNKCGFITERKCLCGHTPENHTDQAECEFCDYKGIVELDANGELACPNCINLHIKKEIINTSEGGVIPLSDILKKSRDIDSSVELSSDLFNLGTVAIVELYKAIDEDVNIPPDKKEGSKASEVYDRINKFSKAIFDRNQENKKDYNLQRFYQAELGKLYNKLTETEREKYRLIDLNYKPKVIKKVEKIKSINVKKKINKEELRLAASELGVGEFTLQAMCVSMNLSVEDAKVKLKGMMDAGKRAKEG